MLNYITFTPISPTLHCYHYYQQLWIKFLLQICLWWFLHIFCFSVKFALLLAVSITLPLLQQQQQQQLTSSLQPVCMLLLLTVLPPTLFSVEAADDGVNFWFPTQLFTQFLLQGLLSAFTLYCSQSLVQLIMSYFYCGHSVRLAHKMISIHAKFNISGHSIPIKKTYDETGNSHSETVPYWTTGMIHCRIECTEKARPYNTTCVTVIMGSKQWNTISSFNKE